MEISINIIYVFDKVKCRDDMGLITYSTIFDFYIYN